METLSEFLNNEENQKVVLEKIIEALRERGEWGKYGIFATIANQVGFSQSYVAKTLKGKMPLRENFVLAIAEYLGVNQAWLRGERLLPYGDENNQNFEEFTFFNSVMGVCDGFARGIVFDGVYDRYLGEIHNGLHEDSEEMIIAFDQKFPQVWAAMESVPEDKRLDVAVYVLAKAFLKSKYSFTPPPTEEQ